MNNTLDVFSSVPIPSWLCRLRRGIFAASLSLGLVAPVSAALATYGGRVAGVWARPEGTYIRLSVNATATSCPSQDTFFLPKEDPLFRSYMNQLNLAAALGHNVILYGQVGVCLGDNNNYAKFMGIDHNYP
jgi:hypothetical protein